MIYQGQAINVQVDADGIAQMQFDLKGDSVNKFNRTTLEELKDALAAIKQSTKSQSIKGLLVTSGKECFIVGADITEFMGHFAAEEDALAAWALEVNKIFNVLEDLPFPTVTVINGIALGGGLEVCLATDFRVMSTKAKVGLPEVKLGIFPGFGGTVRMPRIVGVDNACEWIAAGGQHDAAKALKDGVVDAVLEPEHLLKGALLLLQQCIEGKIDYRQKRQEKLDPLKLPPLENMMAFQTCMATVKQQAGRNYPA
ncbi:MAG: enoyl-CoA hydratase-related protein, partial [Pseudomonadota bacterium]